MKRLATRWDSYFQLPNQGLRAYFKRVVNGQPDVYTAPFGGDKSLSTLLEEWSNICEDVRGEWPSLWEFEISLRQKVGPMSVMKPLCQRMDDVKAYYEDVLLSSAPIEARAVDLATMDFSGLTGLRLRSQVVTTELMKLSTNSGSPYFTKRKRVVNETLPVMAHQEGDEVLMRMHNRSWNATAILGWRGQEGGPGIEDVKQRVVWMFPFGINVQELQLYQPGIQALQKTNAVPAWNSIAAVDKHITNLFDSKNPRDLVICSDFSRFDQHFNTDMANAAKQILTKTVDSSCQQWLEEVFPLKYNIPIAVNWGEVYGGHHGMASGSGGTNFDETLSHRALQHEVALLHGAKLNPYSMCLGDDGILSYPGINANHVVEVYSAHGQLMNADKQEEATDHCTYLRRWHHTRYRIEGVCVGVYSTFRALGRLKMMERYYDPDLWGSKMVALRQLSIIENVKYHPLREQFAEFCMRNDSYRLGLDIPGFIDNIAAIAQEAIDILPDFLGYTKSQEINTESGSHGLGISDWWIVQYLQRYKKS